MAGATIRQGLSSGGRRRARRASAEAEAARRSTEQRLAAADLATEVRVQFARLYAIDRERETLADASQLARMLEATVSARYAAGGADQASVLRAQLEQTRLGQRLADLEAERTIVQAAINRLTNDAAEAPIGPVRDLPPADLPAPAALLAEASLQGAPAVAVSQSGLDVAARQLDAVRAELKPSWSVGVGVFWQGGLDRMVNLSVGVELPFWKKRKQLPLVAAAEGERRAAQLDLADAASRVRAEVVSLIAEHRNATEQVERYENGLLPQNSAALDAARAGYLGGRGDFVSVLDEFRRWIDLRIELAQRRADRYSARARLAALLGGAAATLPVTAPFPAASH
jgi:outer membrane protein TolC